MVLIQAGIGDDKVRVEDQYNTRFELVPGLRNCSKKREEKERQGAGGRVRHRNERRGTRRARRREETVTEIKSVQFGAPRGGRERKIEEERVGEERRDHTASRHFLPDDRATDGRTRTDGRDGRG